MDSNLSDHIERIIRNRPFCKDILKSYGELLSIMESEEPSLGDIGTEKRLKSIKLKGGFPLFPRDELPVDLKSGKRVLLRFLERLLKSKGEKNQRLEKAVLEFQKDSSLLQEVFKAVLETDREGLAGISNRVNLEPERLYFLAKTALMPSLNALRAAFAHELDKTVWDQGYCPFCGSEPDMACLDRTGKRHLHCELCGEDWPYPRLNCPFCQNDDHNTLGYFHSDQEEGFRVDFCRKCGRYIKTIDRRSFESETPMELEYLATLHLDVIANKEGFK